MISQNQNMILINVPTRDMFQIQAMVILVILEHFFGLIRLHNLIYVFLSNRVYDSRENRQIYELNVRTNIHDLIYENLVEIESDIYF